MELQELIKDLGPMKYHYKTRIGNWSEEWELEQYKWVQTLLFADFLSQKN